MNIFDFLTAEQHYPETVQIVSGIFRGLGVEVEPDKIKVEITRRHSVRNLLSEDRDLSFVTFYTRANEMEWFDEELTHSQCYLSTDIKIGRLLKIWLQVSANEEENMITFNSKSVRIGFLMQRETSDGKFEKQEEYSFEPCVQNREALVNKLNKLESEVIPYEAISEC